MSTGAKGPTSKAQLLEVTMGETMGGRWIVFLFGVGYPVAPRVTTQTKKGYSDLWSIEGIFFAFAVIRESQS